MKPSVRLALESMSTTSSEACALANRLLSISNKQAILESDEPSSITDQLREKIASLESQLSDLHMSLIAADYEIDTEAEEPGILALYEHFRKVDVESLAKYNKQYFKQYAPKIRVVVATVLVNVASEKNKQPMPLWMELVASNGEF